MDDILSRLVAAFGPAGGEDPVRDELRRLAGTAVRDAFVDPLGNLVLRTGRAASGVRVLLLAHMDAPGFVVTAIEDSGLVRFAPLGPADARGLVGQRLVFADGIVGVVGHDHVRDPGDLRLDHLFLDIGAANGAEARARIRVGAVATYAPVFEARGTRILATSVDDRAGCAVLCAALASLRESPHDVGVAFTVQEQVGLHREASRGSRVATYGFAPHVVVAVDAVAAGDVPEAPPTRSLRLGEGPGLKVRGRDFALTPVARRMAERAAERAGVPLQIDVSDAPTPAAAAQLAREGATAIPLALPMRPYGPVAAIDRRDLDAAVALVARLGGDEGLAHPGA